MARQRRKRPTRPHDDDDDELLDGGFDADSDTDTREALYGAPLLSVAEEQRLFTQYRATRDPQLKEQLVLANTRLVRKIANHYHVLGGGLTTDDLEMEGMFGLMRAVEKFDPSLGYKFSTMATHWIRQAITRAIDDKAQLIREPVGVQQKRKKAWRKGEKQTGSDTTELRPAWQMVSLDEPRFSESPDEETWADCLAAPDATPVEQQAIDTSYYHATLYQALGMLSARERYVVELRYGLSTQGERWTLEAIATTMNGISRERVRQIEAKAMTHLRLLLVQHADGEVVVRQLELVKTSTKPTRRGRPRKAKATTETEPEAEAQAHEQTLLLAS